MPATEKGKISIAQAPTISKSQANLSLNSSQLSFAFGFGAGVISGDAVPALKALSPKFYERIEKLLGIKKDWLINHKRPVNDLQAALLWVK